MHAYDVVKVIICELKYKENGQIFFVLANMLS